MSLSEKNEQNQADIKEWNSLIKEENDKIRKGHTRIQEKIKDIRQGFSKAVIAGTRSGSGQIVVKHYDKLIKIWGGSASTEPLPFGVNAESFEEENGTGSGNSIFSSTLLCGDDHNYSDNVANLTDEPCSSNTVDEINKTSTKKKNVQITCAPINR